MQPNISGRNNTNYCFSLTAIKVFVFVSQQFIYDVSGHGFLGFILFRVLNILNLSVISFVKFRKFSTIISFFRFHLFFPQTLNFLFCIRVYTVNNVVVVSGEQRRDSAIHIHVSILPQVPFSFRLPHNIEQSSLCCTVVLVGYPL